MLHAAEGTEIFDVLSCVKFRASNFPVSVKFNFIMFHRTDSAGKFIFSSTSEILSSLLNFCIKMLIM